MAFSDRLSEKAGRQLEAAARDPQQALAEAQVALKTLAPATGQAGDHAGGTAPVAASNTIAPLERLLRAHLPNWPELLAASERVGRNTPPITVVGWAQKDGLRSSRGLRGGDQHDVRTIPGALCLHRHPGWLDRLLGWLFALIDRLLAPLLRLREKVDAYLIEISGRLGALFALVSIPLALVGFVADAITLLVSLLRSLPALILSPIALIREIVAIPFRLFAALLSRLVRTLMLAWLGRYLADDTRFEVLLRRYPWLRGVMLGFLRSERPDYPVLIPVAGVTHVLRASRWGFFGTSQYLILIEGAALQYGFAAWCSLKIKQLVLPFYWERTVHMLGLPKGDPNAAEQAITAALTRPATPLG